MSLTATNTCYKAGKVSGIMCPYDRKGTRLEEITDAVSCMLLEKQTATNIPVYSAGDRKLFVVLIKLVGHPGQTK